MGWEVGAQTEKNKRKRKEKKRKEAITHSLTHSPSANAQQGHGFEDTASHGFHVVGWKYYLLSADAFAYSQGGQAMTMKTLAGYLPRCIKDVLSDEAASFIVEFYFE